MRHAGAIRIDHAFQLQRLFLIPPGKPAAEGAYVAYPFEAHARGAAAREPPRTAASSSPRISAPRRRVSRTRSWRSGLLSYRVLPFEREADGVVQAPAGLSAPAPCRSSPRTTCRPSVGWWRGLDIDLRQTLGDLRSRSAPSASAPNASSSAAGSPRRCARRSSSRPPSRPRSRPSSRCCAISRARPPRSTAVQYEDVLGELNQAEHAGHAGRAPELAPQARERSRHGRRARRAAREARRRDGGGRPRHTPERQPARRAAAARDLPSAVPQGLHLRRCGRDRALSGAARDQPCLCLADPQGAAGLDPRLRHRRPSRDQPRARRRGRRSTVSPTRCGSTASASSSTSCRTTWASAAPTTLVALDARMGRALAVRAGLRHRLGAARRQPQARRALPRRPLRRRARQGRAEACLRCRRRLRSASGITSTGSRSAR